MPDQAPDTTILPTIAADGGPIVAAVPDDTIEARPDRGVSPQQPNSGAALETVSHAPAAVGASAEAIASTYNDDAAHVSPLTQHDAAHPNAHAPDAEEDTAPANEPAVDVDHTDPAPATPEADPGTDLAS